MGIGIIIMIYLEWTSLLLKTTEGPTKNIIYTELSKYLM